MTSSVVPGGSSFCTVSTSCRTALPTDTVLASGDRVTDRPTLGRPLRSETLPSSAKPSCTSATWARRTIWSPRRLTTIWPKSCGLSMRPTRRMLWSSRVPRTLPTGAVAFCARKAATTSVTETSCSRSFSARSSTESSRRNAPLTLTTATPLRPRRRSARWSSARREISACDCFDEDRASCMIGCALGSMRCSTGSRISTGSLKRTEPMALRTSSEATTMSLPKSKIRTIWAWPSLAVERTWSMPGMPCSAFSMRLMTSRSTVSGLAPG